MMGKEYYFLLGWSIFRGYVKLPGGVYIYIDIIYNIYICSKLILRLEKKIVSSHTFIGLCQSLLAKENKKHQQTKWRLVSSPICEKPRIIQPLRCRIYFFSPPGVLDVQELFVYYLFCWRQLELESRVFEDSLYFWRSSTSISNMRLIQWRPS